MQSEVDVLLGKRSGCAEEESASADFTVITGPLEQQRGAEDGKEVGWKEGEVWGKI